MSAAAPDPDDPSDVLVIGGGPAGAAAAITLAAAGHRVTIVERRRLPRAKACGDLLAPRAVSELSALGMSDVELDSFHRLDGLRFVAPTSGGAVEQAWPAHPSLPSHGLVARRDRLDGLLVQRAVGEGAVLLDGVEAVAPIVERGFVRGAEVIEDGGRLCERRARYTLVADGANSRFGRSLGTYRERTWPYAAAIRSYWDSPHHDARHLDILPELRGNDGRQLAGYGWATPVGDGTVNIGVMVLSTSEGFRTVNTTHLLRDVVSAFASRWELDPAAPLVSPASGRIPMGGSVGPTAGPTHLVVGDAAGLANPFTGAGIEYALASGRAAGAILAEALGTGDPTALQRYPRLLADDFGAFHKLGRLFDRLAGRPAVMDPLARALTRWPAIGDVALRIGLDELRPRHVGAAESVYRLARAASIVAPDA